jgi:uncharacterized protein (TIGR02246 family)
VSDGWEYRQGGASARTASRLSEATSPASNRIAPHVAQVTYSWYNHEGSLLLSHPETHMKQLSSILFLVVITAATPLLVQADDTELCAHTSEQEVATLFDRWDASLATLDPDKVLALYAPDAVLLPTTSNKPRTNHEEIRDYFVHFLKKKPHAEIDYRIIKIGCNIASDTGLYTFTLHDTNGKVKKVSARYSYVYEHLNGQWLIEHHHSSVLPEPVRVK